MQFDVVVGNPPYNKGMDLDFADLGYTLSSKYTCMITPAKWQTAEANQKISSKNTKYGQFRKEIVPHMKYVCFYPDCLDIFGINEASGITWYLLNKQKTYENNCIIENKSNLQGMLNSRVIRDITKQQSLWNIGQEILDYLGHYKKYNIKEVYSRKGYTININTQLIVSTGASGVWDWDNSCIRPECIGKGGVLFNQNGNVSLTGRHKLLIGDEDSSSKKCIDLYTSDDINECKYYASWLNTKFVRFFILINLSTLTILNDNTFKYVPAPPSDKFDHMYTDDELYKAFNLPQRYIDIIEATLKSKQSN